MDCEEIARKQLDRLQGLPRRNLKSKKGQPNIEEVKNGGKQEVTELVKKPKPSTFDVDSFTIEWDDDDGEPKITSSAAELIEKPEQIRVSPAVPVLPKRIIKKKIIFEPDSADVVSKMSKMEVVQESPPAKKKRSEVAMLLGDEGVQVIMRDQQICIDDNGTLLNIEKPSKTRHQRMRQEEPEKTVNDWNECSMIARRRSSSYSTDSLWLQGDLNGSATEPQEKAESVLSPPKITNLFQSMKQKINKTISDNFDTIALGDSTGGDEENNNVVMVKKPSPRQPRVRQNKSKGSTELTPPASKTKPVETNTGKKTAPPKKPQSQSIETAVPQLKLLIEHSHESFAQVKCANVDSSVTFTRELCLELIEVLRRQRKNKCNLLLIGPIKFSTSPEQTEKGEEENLLTELAKFPKPIFVAVQGMVEGLGVTMLPLFDMVFAKYGSEFSCAQDPLPGMSVLMNSARLDKNRISEMLFLGHSMTSTQAMSCGLITREISSKNDKDFEDKVSQIVRECVDGRYTERIRILKRLWADSHLEQLLRDLNRESASI